MKTSEQFWEVIRVYNQSTIILQFIIVFLLIASVYIAYKWRIYYLPKLAMAVSNLFIGMVFFLIFDKSAVGYYFAFPVYISISVLLFVDSVKNRDDEFQKFEGVSIPLLILVLFYPLISFLLGHHYPRQVLYILPCPVISLSILIYSRYSKQSVTILILMTIWALTGFKAVIFNVMEDLILFITGFYGIFLIAKLLTLRKKVS